MKTLRWLPLVFVAAWAARLPAAQVCVACQQPLRGGFVWFESPALKDKQPLCEPCSKLDTTCFLCGVPVRTNGLRLEDGRLVCAAEAKSLVLTAREAEEGWREVKRELFRLFAGLGAMPDRNVTLSLVNLPDLTRLQTEQPGGKQLTLGLTRSLVSPGAEAEHTIFVLKGLTRPRLMAVLAHEFAHAWLRENLPPDRTLEHDTEEGFCEWVACKVMAQFREESEQRLILANSYTRGQIDAFRKAEETQPFHRLVAWMKSGVDDRLEKTNTARVLAVQTPPVAPFAWMPQVPTAVPDTLVLKAVTVTSRRRLALVNDRTLEKGEEGIVRVGTSNVTVRCLDITPDSVLLEVRGSPAPLRLRRQSQP